MYVYVYVCMCMCACVSYFHCKTDVVIRLIFGMSSLRPG